MVSDYKRNISSLQNIQRKMENAEKLNVKLPYDMQHYCQFWDMFSSKMYKDEFKLNLYCS